MTWVNTLVLKGLAEVPGELQTTEPLDIRCSFCLGLSSPVSSSAASAARSSSRRARIRAWFPAQQGPQL